MTKRRWGAVVVAGAALAHVVLLTYILRYTPNYPLPVDDWVGSFDVAQAAATGANPLPYIFADVNHIHIHVPAYFVIYVLTLTTNWNLQLTVLINYVLSVINLGLLLQLYTRNDRSYWIWLLLPFTLFVLAPQQEVNWIAGLHSVWHFVVMFTLLAFLMVTRRPRTTANLMWAAVAGFAASSSLLVGMVVWPLVFLSLPFLGYRRWQHYGLWVGISFLMVVGYLNYPGIDPRAGALLDEGETLVQPSGLGQYIVYVLIFLGGVLGAGPNHTNLLIIIFLVIVSGYIAIANMWYLWHRCSSHEEVVISIMLMLYVIGSGILNALGRMNTFGMRWGAANHYITVGLLFMVSVTAVVLLALRSLVSKRYKSHQRLMVTNVLFIAVVSFYYLIGAVTIFRVTEADQSRVQAIEACIEAVAAGADFPECEVNGGVATRDRILELSELGLTGFR